MTVVVLLCLVLLLTAIAAWGGYRRKAVLTWDRELEAAFGSGDHRPANRHRAR